MYKDLAATIQCGLDEMAGFGKVYEKILKF